MNNVVTPTGKSANRAVAWNNSTNHSNHMSKKEKQLKSVLSLMELSCLLRDVSLELKFLADLFSDKSNLNRKQQQAIRSLMLTVIPFLSKSSESVADSAENLALIASTNYIHEKDEKNRRNKMADEIHDSNRKKKSITEKTRALC